MKRSLAEKLAELERRAKGFPIAAFDYEFLPTAETEVGRRYEWLAHAASSGYFAPELYGDTHATWVNCTNKGQPRGRGAIGLNHTESGVTVMFRAAAMRVVVENPGSKGAGMMQRRLAAVGQV